MIKKHTIKLSERSQKKSVDAERSLLTLASFGRHSDLSLKRKMKSEENSIRANTTQMFAMMMINGP